MDHQDNATVILSSSDGEEVKVSKHVAAEAKTLSYCIEDFGVEGSINLPVDGPSLRLVIKYLTHYANHKTTETLYRGGCDLQMPRCLSCFELDFFKDDVRTVNCLSALVKALNYLGSPEVLIQGCAVHMARETKNKSPAEVREMFGFPDNLSEREKLLVERDLRLMDTTYS